MSRCTSCSALSGNIGGCINVRDTRSRQSPAVLHFADDGGRGYTIKSIRQVIYISQASRPLRDWEIDELVTTASRNNRLRDVTGALLFIESSFVQVLEGECGQISELLATIAADPRHTNMRILSDEEIGHRHFSDWSMALVKPEQDDRPGVAGEVRSTVTQVDEDEPIVVPLPHTISMMRRLYETDAALQRARSR